MTRPLAVAGLAAVALVALLVWLLGIPAGDGLVLATLAAFGALITGAAGLLALRMLRRRTLGVQVTAAALTALAGVVVGAVAAANKMFISGHDLRALLVIVAAASGAGTAVTLVLGATVASGRVTLGEAARRMGAGEVLAGLEEPATRELASLAGELRETSARLDEMRRRERSLDQSRRELVAWVSHDLRTPLAGIRAMAEALEDRVVVEHADIARYHSSIRAEADRLAELVDDLFELSRINAGALKLSLEKASLKDVISDALASTAATAEAKGVQLQGRMTAEPPDLELATLEMSRVLRNLLENAIRHTPADGSVSVEGGVQDSHAYVSVADSCGGIARDDMERVFDVAWRGEAARSPANGGAGLGLAIARGIVEAHNGHIEVCNVDNGCRFTVHLPLESGLGPVRPRAENRSKGREPVQHRAQVRGSDG